MQQHYNVVIEGNADKKKTQDTVINFKSVIFGANQYALF